MAVNLGRSSMQRIEIVNHDPRWGETFRKHAAIITEALGDTARGIEHVGSTAVPGLAAKPIVDILLVVRDSGDESTYLPPLVAAGYELRIREPEFHQHRMFRTSAGDIHLHVLSAGSTEVERMLRFRNRLRTNDDDRKAYEETKRRLAAEVWPDMDAYARAKTDIIERILAAATEEK